MELLRIEGAIEHRRDLSFSDLGALPGQIPDVAQLLPGREGGGVRLQSVLNVVSPDETARYITLSSSDGKFSASVPLEAVHDAIIAYRLGDEPLPSKKGGPFRFFIPNVEDCAIGGVDERDVKTTERRAALRIARETALGRELGAERAGGEEQRSDAGHERAETHVD